MADEATERITILLQAKDKDFARAMERNNKLIAKFERQATRGTTSAARNIDRNLAQMGTSILGVGKAFATGLAGGVIGAVFAGVTSNIRGMIGEIADLNDAAGRIGLGVEELQGLQAGFKLAGVEVEDTSKGLETFSQRIGEAAAGEGSFLQVLERNNIALRDQAGNVRPTIDLLRDYAGAIGGAGSSQERLALAADAFGKSGRAMVLGLEGGRGAVDGLIESARDAGLVLDEELVQKAAELDDKFDIITMKLGVMFKGAVVGAAEFFTSATTAAQVLEEKFGTLEKAKAQFGASAVESFAAGNIDDARNAVFEYEAVLREADAAAGDVAITADSLAQELFVLADGFDAVGSTAAADAVYEVASEMEDAVQQFRAGTIDGAAFADKLDEVRIRAGEVLDPLAAIDGASFEGVIGRLSQLGGALEVVRNIAVSAIGAVTALAPISVADQTTGTPLTSGQDLLPPSVPTVTSSPRPPAAPNNIDFGIPDAPKGGSSGGGGGNSETNEMLREAERLFEQTRTEAEKYAAELENLNELQRLGYIDADTYGRAIEKLGEQYGQTGLMSEDFKSTILDLADGTLTLADAFDQLRMQIIRAAAEYLIFGSNPFATGGSMQNTLLGGLAGLIPSFEGGGSTGSGSRSGGVDGKGGYMAVVHPKETVIDHTKSGGSAVAAGSGGMQVAIGFDASVGDLTAVIRDEAGRVVASARQGIVQQSVSAVDNAMRRTKQFGGGR